MNLHNPTFKVTYHVHNKLLNKPLYHVTAGTAVPICATVKVNGANLRVEVDTGASLSLISEVTLRRKSHLKSFSLE